MTNTHLAFELLPLFDPLSDLSDLTIFSQLASGHCETQSRKL